MGFTDSGFGVEVCEVCGMMPTTFKCTPKECKTYKGKSLETLPAEESDTAEELAYINRNRRLI